MIKDHVMFDKNDINLAINYFFILMQFIWFVIMILPQIIRI
jgi:hypothetical protein